MKMGLIVVLAAGVLAGCGGAGVPPEAVSACEQRLRAAASNPSTVTFVRSGQSTDRGAPGGGYRVRLGFEAKNDFGLTKRYDSVCLFQPNSLAIAEAGAWERGS